MNAWRLLGYVLLSLVDAAWLPVIVVGVLFLGTPADLWTRVAPYALGLGGIVFVTAFVVGLLRLRSDGRPFPLTRGFVWLVNQATYWYP